MIRLLALAPADGWAFARSGDRILLLRPPYGKRRHPAVEESAVARAVAVEGFTAEDRDFTDWPALFAFLEEQFLAGRPALPAALAPESIERILRHAPHSALEGLLDRIERELLPGRQWDAAGELLARFLSVESPGAVLRSRAADILVHCQQERSAAAEQRNRLVESVQAPLAAQKYGREAVRARTAGIRHTGFWSTATRDAA
jgi:hypothetical protein